MEILFLVLLILLMIGALASGFPVAFALPGSAILAVAAAAFAGWAVTGHADAYFAQGGPQQWLTAGVTNFRGIYWEAERDTLIAIPLFVFMGIMLQRSRIAEDLLVTMAQLFGPVRGGLGMSVVFVGGLLAATTGIVGATVVAMGLISLPAMLRNNYSHPLATGTIAASGTLGQIIPPSIVLIILADQLAGAADQASSARKALYKTATGQLTMPSEFDVSSTSAGEMFLGAFIPGIILVVVYMVFIAILALVRPKVAPAVPYDGKYDARFAVRVAVALVPPLALIFVVLGSIILGIATVNQAGAVGAAGAMIMAGYRLREGHRRAYWPVTLAVLSVAALFVITRIHHLNAKNITTAADVFWLTLAAIAVVVFLAALVWSGWRTLKIDNTLQGVMLETAKTTSLVFIILIGATMLTAAFRGFGGEDLVREFLTGLPGGFWGQFAIVMAVIFLLGFFLDFIEIAVVVVPIVAPILLADPGANVTAVWLGVMVVLNIQTSFLTPPFGFALFYLRGVAPAIVRTLSIYRGVIAFICLQLLVLAFVAVTPRLVNYLPNRIALASATAPPPVNPKLQVCIEDIVFKEYDAQGGKIRAAIAEARALDLGILPARLKTSVAGSLDKSERTFALLQDIRKAEGEIAARLPAYRPLHEAVREIQYKIKSREDRLREPRQDLSRVAPGAAGAVRREMLETTIAALEAEQKALQASIPASWEQQHKDFEKLLVAETKARRDYRRNADDAYGPIAEAISIIDAAGALAALKERIEGLRAVIGDRTPEQAAEQFAQAMTAVNAVPGSRDVGAELAKARRALRGRTPDKAEALKSLDAALKTHAAELEWRARAADTLLQPLKTYETAIRGTIGLRQQPRLPQERLPEIAGCLSYHRDISLYF
jgi:tripartite ATP-independent transporter DctM subunit